MEDLSPHRNRLKINAPKTVPSKTKISPPPNNVRKSHRRRNSLSAHHAMPYNLRHKKMQNNMILSESIYNNSQNNKQIYATLIDVTENGRKLQKPLKRSNYVTPLISERKTDSGNNEIQQTIIREDVAKEFANLDDILTDDSDIVMPNEQVNNNLVPFNEIVDPDLSGIGILTDDNDEDGESSGLVQFAERFDPDKENVFKRISVIGPTDASVAKENLLNSTFTFYANDTEVPISLTEMNKITDTALNTPRIASTALVKVTGLTLKCTKKLSPEVKRLQSCTRKTISHRSGTPFQRKSIHNNVVNIENISSAKKENIIKSAKEEIAMTIKNTTPARYVAFNLPALDCIQTPRAESIRERFSVKKFKKTPFKFEGNENFKISQHEKPTDWKKIKVTQIKEIEEKNLMENISKVKLPNFRSIHQKMFNEMESLDKAIIRVDERAKTLMSGKKIPSQKEIVTSAIPRPLKVLNPQKSSTITSVGIQKFDRINEANKFADRSERRKQMYKQRPDATLTNKTKKLKGVRSNRRFELMMKFRNEQN